MIPIQPSYKNESTFRRLNIFGAGGSGRETAWLAERVWGETIDIHFVVDDLKYLKKEVNGFPMCLLSDLAPADDARYLIALGDPLLRAKYSKKCNDAGLQPTTLIHPRAELSRWINIGEGTTICANCILSSNVQLGVHVQVNFSTSISHDVLIGDYSTLSPGVNIAGNVRMGRGVFVGMNACIINGRPTMPLHIGDGAIIAAGACVTQSVDPGALVAGVPAARKR